MNFLQRLLSPAVGWIREGFPDPAFYNYMRELDDVARHSIQFREKYFTFADDGLTLDIGNIPVGAMIVKPISGIHVIEAFNAGTTNVADIGPSTDTDLWATDLALGTIGFIPLDEAVSNVVGNGQGLAQVAVDLTGSAATTGKARAMIAFIVPRAI